MKQLTSKSAKSKPIGLIMYEQKESVVEDSKKAAPLTFSFQQLEKNLPNLFTPKEVNIDPTFYRITPSIGDSVV